jgi:SAM-dependent methyltransferase
MKRDSPDAGTARVLGLGPEEGAALRRAAARLTLLERVHLEVRFRSVPWHAVLPAFEPEGSLADLGCGPGLLAHLLARAGFRGTYLGVDPDARKVDRARAWLGSSSVRRFEAGTVDLAPASAFSQAALIDVLYLVHPSERPAFVAAAVRCLAPGGLFVAVTSGGGPGWKRHLDTAQERVAVGLGITKGEAVAPCDGPQVARLLTGAGLEKAAVTDIGRGYLHGFERITARRPPA